ncbi:MAG: hypothetical protein AAGL17_05585, partial [Cyanobacteria bacterium J06576_12]
MDALCFAPSRHLLAPIGAEQPNLQTDFDEAGRGGTGVRPLVATRASFVKICLEIGLFCAD